MLVARAQQMALRGDKLFFIIISLSVLGTITTLSSDVNNGTPTHRKRRAMVFPSGTVLQFGMGLSIPVSVPNRTLTMSVYYQMVYNLPTEASQWYALPDIAAKRDVSSTALLDMYIPLEEFLEENGFEGRACVLRSICEAANSPFHQDNVDLLGEVAHAILTPSEEMQPEERHCSNSSYVLETLPVEKQYLAAECLGKSEGNCETAYPDCPKSLLDMMSQTLNVEMFTD